MWYNLNLCRQKTSRLSAYISNKNQSSSEISVCHHHRWLGVSCAKVNHRLTGKRMKQLPFNFSRKEKIKLCMSKNEQICMSISGFEYSFKIKDSG